MLREYRDPVKGRVLVSVAGAAASVAVATGGVYALRPIAPTLSLGVLYIPPVLAAAALLREGSLDELGPRSAKVLAGADDLARRRFEAAIESLLVLARERQDAEAVRRSDALKTIILQTVSHDFRTPLATISAAVG